MVKQEKMSLATYDDVFHTMLIDCRHLIIPVVNEVFHTHYIGNEKIILKENEIYIKFALGEEKRITDASFEIRGIITEETRYYHLECQSVPDRSMLIRMYEYDSQIALKNSLMNDGILEVNFPNSAIIYLRHSKNTPEKFKLRIHTPEGSVSYKIPTLRIRNYNIEEIFYKKLYFLIPFYIFCYENKFKNINNNEEQLKKLMDEYYEIKNRLEKLCLEEKLDTFTKSVICTMTENVINRIAKKYKNIREGVTEVMGGKVLDYEAKRILNRGKELGKELGIKEGFAQGAKALLSLVEDGILTMSEAAKRADMTEEELAKYL